MLPCQYAGVPQSCCCRSLVDGDSMVADLKLKLLSLVHKSDSLSPPPTHSHIHTHPSFAPHPLRHQLKNMAITFPRSYGNTTLQPLCGGRSVCVCVCSQSCVGVCACAWRAEVCLDNVSQDQFFKGLMSSSSSRCLSLINYQCSQALIPSRKTQQ